MPVAWLIDSHEDGFEPVLVEEEWYDGPRSGVALVGGVPHYFRCVHDYGDIDDYLVWPAEERAVRWEREQWSIFVAWSDLHDRGLADVATHPGQGGVDARFDELQARLAPLSVSARHSPPDDGGLAPKRTR
jgi:hypothetical protein